MHVRHIMITYLLNPMNIQKGEFQGDDVIYEAIDFLDIGPGIEKFQKGNFKTDDFICKAYLIDFSDFGPVLDKFRSYYVAHTGTGVQKLFIQ